MVRQSILRRDLRMSAPYAGPLPAPSGPFSRPSVSGATNGGGYEVYKLIRQMEEARITQSLEKLFALKDAVHGNRLSTIVRTPD